MGNNFKQDLNDSIFDFQRVVLPKLTELKFISGEIIPIETSMAIEFQRLIKQFDMLAGVDLWQIKNKEGIRGIANRVQWINIYRDDFKTFTIRKHRQSGVETEYSKRLKSINSESWLYPYLTIQSYMLGRRREGSLAFMAITQTKLIFETIEKGEANEDYFEKPNKADGNIFICVPWESIKKRHGKLIKIYDSGNNL